MTSRAVEIAKFLRLAVAGDTNIDVLDEAPGSVAEAQVKRIQLHYSVVENHGQTRLTVGTFLAGLTVAALGAPLTISNHDGVLIAGDILISLATILFILMAVMASWALLKVNAFTID